MAQLSPALEEVSNCERRHAPVRQAHPGPGTGSGCVRCAVPGRLLHVAGLPDDAAGLARRPALRADAFPSRLGSRGRHGGRHHAGLPWRLRAVHGGDGLLPGHDGGILQGAVLCHPLLHRFQRDAPHGSARPRSQYAPWTRRFVVPHRSPWLCWRKQPADRSFLDVARHAQPDAGYQRYQYPAVPQHLCRLPHPAHVPCPGPRAGRPPLVGACAVWSPRGLLRRHAHPQPITWWPAGAPHHPPPLPGHAPKRAASQGILGVFLLVAALALTFWLKRDVFVPMLLSMTVRINQLVAFVGGAQDANLYARVVLIRDAWAMLLRRPVLGTGAGTYQYVYTQFRSIPFYAKFPHSIVFEELVDMGVLGGIAFLALIGSLLWRGLRIARREQATVFAGLLAGAFGNVLHAAVDFDWSLLAMPVLFFVTCGLLVSRERREPGVAQPHVALGHRHSPRSARLLTGVAFVVVVWSAVFVILLSAANTALAQRAEFQGDLPSAQYRYRTAVRLAPLGAEQKADLAAFLQTKVEASAQDQSAVGREVQQLYEAATRLNPRMWAYHDALARLYLERGDARAGVEAQSAVDRNPLRADGWFVLAVARNAAGDQAGAGQALDRAVQLQEQGSN